MFYVVDPMKPKDADSMMFFTSMSFPNCKKSPIYKKTSPNAVTRVVPLDSYYVDAQRYIMECIPSVKPKYSYPGEGCINPGYQNITSIRCPLRFHEKRIWALRSDFILATGVKNAYQKEYGYTGLKDSFSRSLHSFINWEDRYGHPSLTYAEGSYDGAAFYAGYICQRRGYLQIYLVSGRFERTDLGKEQTCILEAYIASQFQSAYGNQEIVFDHGDSEVPSYHATFFGSGVFDKSNPQRRYNHSLIREILQDVPKVCFSGEYRQRVLSDRSIDTDIEKKISP